jgi:hypothetical protein
MDQRVKEVMEGAMMASQSQYQSIETQLATQAEGFVDSCFERNSSNSDRFAECIVNKISRT